MEWLNEHSGLMVLLTSIIIIALLIVAVVVLINLRGKMTVQKLHFLGFYSADVNTREYYAELTIGNKSLNDIGISELGIRNGNINFNFTEVYKEKKGLPADARIVIEQRSAITFCLTTDDLKQALIDGEDGTKVLKTLKVYAVDLTGNCYYGKVNAVKRLLSNIMNAERHGVTFGGIKTDKS